MTPEATVQPAAVAPKGKRGLNLVIAKDDKDLCKEMFGDLYTDDLFASMADEGGCISQERMMTELAKLKAGAEETLSAQAAATLFASKLQTGIAVSCELKQLKGLYGRLDDSGEEGGVSSLPFAFDHKGLHALLQCTDGRAMFTKFSCTEQDLDKKLDGSEKQFKLIIFSDASVTPPPALATWEAVVERSCSGLPEDGVAKLRAHLEALKTTPFDQIIDPRTAAIEGNAVMTVEQYLASEDTLWSARQFVGSRMQLSGGFSGAGALPDGTGIYVMGDVGSIEGAQTVDVSVAPRAS